MEITLVRPSVHSPGTFLPIEGFRNAITDKTIPRQLTTRFRLVYHRGRNGDSESLFEHRRFNRSRSLIARKNGHWRRASIASCKYIQSAIRSLPYTARNIESIGLMLGVSSFIFQIIILSRVVSGPERRVTLSYRFQNVSPPPSLVLLLQTYHRAPWYRYIET